jgi:hypothetical protein
LLKRVRSFGKSKIVRKVRFAATPKPARVTRSLARNSLADLVEVREGFALNPEHVACF